MSRRGRGRARAVNEDEERDEFVNRDVYADRHADLARRELELDHRERQLVNNSFNYEDIKNVVGEFGGDGLVDVKRWIKEFEEFSEIAGWRELQNFVWAKRLVQGTARSVLQSAAATSWMEIKEILLNEFNESFSSAKIHLMLRERSKHSNESSRQYFIAMKELGARGKVELGSIIQYVIAGIQDREINKIMLYGAVTAMEFNEKLDLYDLVTAKSKKETVEINREQFQQPVKYNQQLRDSAPRFRNRYSPYARESQPGTSKDHKIRCFDCGEFGHHARNCRKKEQVGPKCFQCENFGHIARNCPSSNRTLRYFSSAPKEERVSIPGRNSNVVMNNISIKKGNMKEVLINGSWMSSLIDTGSDLNILSWDKYQSIGAPELSKENMSFKGVGNLMSHSIGFFEAKMVIDKEDYVTRIHVAESNVLPSPIQFILGMEFLDGLNVCFRNGSVYIVGTANQEANVLTTLSVDTDEIDFAKISHSKYIRDVMVLVKDYKPTGTSQSPVVMKILLQDESPVVLRSRRLPESEKIELDKQINEWLDDGIIRRSQSDYSSPVVLVTKKDGSKRICIDYRQLNKKIIKDRYPLPVIEDQIDQLQAAKIFTALDLKNGFFHVPVHEDSRKFTAFITATDHFEFCKVPFGLCNSPAVFSKFIHVIFEDLKRRNVVLTYMDDLIIPAKDEEEALQRLKEVFQRCASFGLVINWKKCQFLTKKISYLGYEIEDGVVRPGEEKIKAVKEFPEPKNIKEIQRFLGLSGYFRKFIYNYSLIAKPLSDLLKSDSKFVFGMEQEESFNRLKLLLVDRPVLNIFRFTAPTELHTDASKYAFGAILLQMNQEDEKWHPVFFFSRKTTISEQNLSSYELEMLAVVNALKKLRVYLLGIKFKIITDCSAFQMTLDKKDVSPKIARWSFLLQEFDYSIEHRSAERMKHVDALSRIQLVFVVVSQVEAAQSTDPNIIRISENLDAATNRNFVLQNGILYKEVRGDKLLYIPKAMELQILKSVHDKGHFGVKKMVELIEREYFIPDVGKKCELWIKNCVSCILGNRKEGKQEGFLNPIPKEGGPLSTYHVDHIGPLATTSKKYKYILTVIDAFSKFIWIYPTKTVSAEEAIGKLELQQKTFGNPRRIISDRGSSFTAKVFHEYCETEKIQHNQIVTGVSRGNGQVERAHRIIKSSLIKLAIDDPQKWFKFTDKLQMAINATFQRSIGRSPFEILVGVPLRWNDDLNFKEILEEEILLEFLEERENLREQAKENIRLVQKENRESFDKKRKVPTVYKVGDVVAIKKTQFSKGKLYPPYLGPYKILEAFDHDRYRVQKIGEHEGPETTFTVVDFMKKWSEEGLGKTSESEVLSGNGRVGLTWQPCRWLYQP